MKSKIRLEELVPDKGGKPRFKDGKPRFKVHWREGSVKGGAKKRRSKTFHSLHEAEFKVAELEATTGRLVNDYTIAELAQEFEDGEMVAMHDTTSCDYRFILEKWIIPELGNYLIEQVTPADVRALMQRCATTPLPGRSTPGGDTTANKIRRILMTMYRAAAMREWTAKDPARAAKRFKLDPRPMNPFTIVDLQAMLELVEVIFGDKPEYKPMSLIIALGASTGLRQGELMGLKWRDISIGGHLLEVKQQWTSGREGKLKTARAYRSVPYSDDVGRQLVRHQQLMSEWRRPAQSDDWVFPDTRIGLNGNFDPFSQSTLLYRFRKIMAQAGMDAKAHRFHDLRAAFAVNSLRAGIPLNEVQVLLGHESPIMTLLYAKYVSDEVAGDSLRKISNQLLPPKQKAGLSGPRLALVR